MTDIDWDSVFDKVHAEPRASKAEIQQLVNTIFEPVSSVEAAEINSEEFNLAPTTWRFPTHSLPDSYLSLLRWSNGASCVSGEREFGFFTAMDPRHGVRAMMLAYHVPQYMPLAVPFAFNGGGTFYLFDMRQPPVNGEYPIVCCGSGALGFDDQFTATIANSLLEACSGREDVDSLRLPQTVFTNVHLTLTQQLPLRQLATLNKLFKLCDSVGQLRSRFADTPVLLTEIGLERARSLLTEYPGLRDALEARDTENPEIVYPLAGA